jgi:ribosomal protein L7Ae-like RNA K-turn-binding protein
MALPEINGQLHLARKAGVLVYGIEELSIELKRDKVALVLFSATIGKSAARKLRNWQEQYRQVAFFCRQRRDAK